MLQYPRIQKVEALPGKRLLVSFRNDDVRVYDCTPLLADSAFRQLANEAFFYSVQVDPHGYGVIWSEEVDLSESELWLHGTPFIVENTR
jgi:hypothetical protein